MIFVRRKGEEMTVDHSRDEEITIDTMSAKVKRTKENPVEAR